MCIRDRPYSPVVLMNYLCASHRQRTAETVSTQYEKVDLVYRYNRSDADSYHLPSKQHIVKRTLSHLLLFMRSFGPQPLCKTGFTLIPAKGFEQHRARSFLTVLVRLLRRLQRSSCTQPTSRHSMFVRPYIVATEVCFIE